MNNPQRRPVNWTPQMVGRLVEWYPLLFNATLAQMLGVSLRTLQRKAANLGLKKPDGFMENKADDYSRKMSAAIKKAYAEGRKTSIFKPGVQNNPNGGFPKGFRFTGEIEAERIDKIRRTYRKKKLLANYGLSK